MGETGAVRDEILRRLADIPTTTTVMVETPVYETTEPVQLHDVVDYGVSAVKSWARGDFDRESPAGTEMRPHSKRDEAAEDEKRRALGEYCLEHAGEAVTALTELFTLRGMRQHVRRYHERHLGGEERVCDYGILPEAAHVLDYLAEHGIPDATEAMNKPRVRKLFEMAV